MLASQSTKISEFQGSGKPYFKNKTEFFYAAIKVLCVYVFLHSLLQQVDINTPNIAGIILHEVREEPEKKTESLPLKTYILECKLNTVTKHS